MARSKARFGRAGARRVPQRARRLGERGAQALEYIGLGSAVAGMMGGAAIYLQHHGGEVGGLLLDHVKNVLGQ